MGKISMVMFDLSGTTVHDDTGVRDCLYKAAQEFNLKTTPDEILLHMGTNKIHLYQFLIARERGKDIDFKNFEKFQDPQTYDLAKKVFDRIDKELFWKLVKWTNFRHPNKMWKRFIIEMVILIITMTKIWPCCTDIATVSSIARWYR